MKFFSWSTLSLFDWFLIIGIIALNIVYSVLMRDIDIMGTVAGISGVLCVVLVAKRSMANYLFGIINVTLYAIIAYKSKIYGDAVLNAFYYFPMQFIGWFGWIKHTEKAKNGEADNSSLVKARRMTVKQRLLLIITCFVLVTLSGYILARWTSDPQPYKDAATTVLAIIAQYLMVKMFLEQWILWIVVNVVSTVMWIYLLYTGQQHSALMVGMWLFYLANSINGYRVWYKASKNGF
jgi:nicotinamide mononucleotide transporter